MMLQALYELAQIKGLLDQNYQVAKPSYAIRVGDGGTFAGLDKLSRACSVPRVAKRAGSGVEKPGFLFDKCLYVLGIEGPRGRTPRAAEGSTNFRNQVAALATTTQDPGALAAAAFLARLADHQRQVLALSGLKEWTGTETFVFQYDKDPDGSYVHMRPEVDRYWRTYRLRQSSGPSQGFQCLVTGLNLAPAWLHYGVRGIPGAKHPSTLVSFNQESFRSYGLEKGHNAPVCTEVAEAYVAALAWLLERDPESERSHRAGIPVGKNTVLCFWATKPCALEQDIHSLAARNQEADLNTLLRRSLWALDAPEEIDPTPFYATVLSGDSRLVVRMWIETTAGEVVRNIWQYHQDMAGPEGPQPTPIWFFPQALGVPKKGQSGAKEETLDLPDHLQRDLIRVVLFGDVPSRALYNIALNRFRLADKKGGRTRVRAGVIRAYLNRLFRRRQLPLLTKEIPMALDEDTPQVAYQLGRLFAVLDTLQNAAQKNVGASIRNRFFTSASTCPASVFGRLIPLSDHHLKKSRRFDLEAVKEEVMGRIPTFPKYLTPEESGLFTLGYYHQRTVLYLPKEKKQERMEERKKATANLKETP